MDDSTDPITIDAGGGLSGSGIVTGAFTQNGTVTASGGTLELSGSVTGGGGLFIDSGADLQLDSFVANTESIDFAGTGATLLSGPLAPPCRPTSRDWARPTPLGSWAGR